MLSTCFSRKSVSIFFRGAAVAALAVFCRADSVFADADNMIYIQQTPIANYGILFEGTSAKSLTITSATTTVFGNIGIGGTGVFSGSGGGSINGDLNFSATSIGQNTNSLTLTGTTTFNGVHVSPTTSFSVAGVTSALTAANSLSTSLGALTTTNAGVNSITGGGSVTLAAGDNVFNITSPISFNAASTYTVTGTSSEFVVFNIPSADVGTGLNGAIKLVGIDSDHVIFNYYQGGTLSMNTGNVRTHGTFLDPTGNFTISNTLFDGRLIGGGSTANSTFASSILASPEPSSFVLAALGILGLFGARRYSSKRKGQLA
jgi:PEP-CTERM motif-containing protein